MWVFTPPNGSAERDPGMFPAASRLARKPGGA
jgi:hypothetical protein